MTTLDDISASIAALAASISTFAASEYARGLTDQTASDQAVIDGLNAQIDALGIKITSLQTRLAAQQAQINALITAGAAPLGSTSYVVPADAVFVAPTGVDTAPGTETQPLKTLKKALSLSASVIVLRGGSYHEGITVQPTKKVTVQAYPGEAVWLDGSEQITNWTQNSNGTWSHAWTPVFDSSPSFTKGGNDGFVNSAYPMAADPQMMFYDGARLQQAPNGKVPASGQFSIVPGKTVTVGDSPQGHEVRGATLQQAFVVGGALTLLGVGVRRYATSLPQIAAVFVGGSVGGSYFENCYFTDNATQGLAFGVANCQAVHCTASGNGLTGMVASSGSDNGRFYAVNCSNNNVEHFNTNPQSGGIKCGRSSGLVIAHSVFDSNVNSSGIWLDSFCTNFTIVNNKVTNNPVYGIEAEISDTGIIAGNEVSGSKYGITCYDTGNVKIYGNSCHDNGVWDYGLTQDSRRNSDPACPCIVRNIEINNNISDGKASFSVYALDKATHIPASAMIASIDGNIFLPGRAVMVGWGGSDNTSVTYVATPTALNIVAQAGWNNATTESSAEPTAIPSDVAAALTL